MLESILLAYSPLICLTIAAIILIIMAIFILLKLRALTKDVENEDQRVLAISGLIFLAFVLFFLGANLLNQIVVLIR